MKRKPPTPPRTTAPAPPLGRGDVDVLVRDALGEVATLLVLCGYPPAELVLLFKQRCEAVPKSVRRHGASAKTGFVDVPHVLSLWFNDPEYVTPMGAVRALPVRGKGQSIETLAARVDPDLPVDAVIRALRAAKVLVRRGRKYVPRERTLSFRAHPNTLRAHSLRALNGMLRTLKHNLLTKPDGVRWLEYIAENPNVSDRTNTAIYPELFARGKRFLETIDDRLVRAEQAVRPGEKTKRVGWGVYYFEEPSGGGGGGRRSGRRLR